MENHTHIHQNSTPKRDWAFTLLTWRQPDALGVRSALSLDSTLTEKREKRNASQLRKTRKTNINVEDHY